MAKLSNPWVGYFERSYESIKASLLSRLVLSNPEIRDHSESNILVIILSMFAGLLEMLNLYVDNMAREAFIGTARLFSSSVRLVKLIDYRIKARVPSSSDVTFYSLDIAGLPIAITAPAVIPALTEVSTESGIKFLTSNSVNLALGDTSATVGIRQITKVNNFTIGTTTPLANQAYAIGTDYVHNSLSITINNIVWELKQTLGLSDPTSLHYIVEIDSDNIAKVVFGNGLYGQIPPSGFPVISNYETTLGVEGNVGANTIINILTPVTLPGSSSITVNNILAAVGGTEYEDVDQIAVSAPLSLRTLDRAVTFQDYEDIARLAPGVGLSKVIFDCGKTVDIYIAPVGGGIATSPLLQAVSDFFEPRRMITTFIRVQPAGITNVGVKLDVTAKFRRTSADTEADIITAFQQLGLQQNQDINRKIRTSDIIALIDNLEKVDFLTLSNLYTVPYARPANHTIQLDWVRKSLPNSTQTIIWRIQWSGTDFRLFKADLFMGVIPVNTTYTDPDNILEFTAQAGPYTIGYTWFFTTYASGLDINLDDNTVPTYESVNLDITVIENLNPHI